MMFPSTSTLAASPWQVASAFAFSLGLVYGNIKNAQGLQVFRIVEQPDSNEKSLDQKTQVKFQIMSLKVKAETDYAPELFDEQKDQSSS
ncbi:vesicle-associated protein 4-2-like [Rosa chinensis]|uniref:vesicle-associated protein 4-2-like n=1 Tax=Rosa chinensis TaxID=74649 RepID=UPI001AD937FD|nr:vesicle-associated protein 4-2-like [Rosa chinensis]